MNGTEPSVRHGARHGLGNAVGVDGAAAQAVTAERKGGPVDDGVSQPLGTTMRKGTPGAMLRDASLELLHVILPGEGSESWLGFCKPQIHLSDRSDEVGNVLLRIGRVDQDANISVVNLNGPGAAAFAVRDFSFRPIEGGPVVFHC